MKVCSFHQVLLMLMAASIGSAQYYQTDDQDYYAQEDFYAQEGDTLYQDYAQDQEKKAQGGGG